MYKFPLHYAATYDDGREVPIIGAAAWTLLRKSETTATAATAADKDELIRSDDEEKKNEPITEGTLYSISMGCSLSTEPTWVASHLGSDRYLGQPSL